MLRGRLLACVAAAALLSGCSDDGADSPSALSPSPSPATTAAGSPAPTPSLPPSASPSSRPSPSTTRIVVDTKAVAGVPMGTAADDAERRLRLVLGPPKSQPIAECTREKGRTLTWGTLTVILSDGAEGGPVTLYGWEVERGPSRFQYSLPFDAPLATSARELVRTVPGATGLLAEEGPYSGSYLVRTTRAEDLFWIAPEATDDTAVVEYVTYRSHTCD